MANCSLLSLCVLAAVLSVIGNATAAAIPFPPFQRRPTLGPAAATIIPKVTECWKAILESTSCAQDILKWLAVYDVHVSKVCCTVLEQIGDKCIVDVFSNFPFNPLYPPLVKRICGFAM